MSKGICANCGDEVEGPNPHVRDRKWMRGGAVFTCKPVDWFVRWSEEKTRTDAALSRVRELEQQAARVRGETIEECAKRAVDLISNGVVVLSASEVGNAILALAPAAGGDAK